MEELSARVHLDARSDGVALLTLNNPPVNSLSPQVLGELAVQLKQAQARSDVKAIVLIGANRKFSGGADIKSMSKASDKVQATEDSGLALMNDIVEGSPKPVVAAIAGFALGGGLELAMACHARVAAPGARLGLPELQLGIIPGLGGTQRLPRLVGVETAIDMMLSVRMLTTEEAHQRGLVDAVCDITELVAVAADYALGIVRQKYPFAKTLERTDKVGPTQKALQVLAQAREKARRTYKHVDYPFVCLDAVEHGIRNGGLEGTILERKLGVQIVSSSAAKALMHIFLAERAAYKVPGVNERGLQNQHRIRRVGVVGGGLMGSGIATALLLHNVHVQLKEVDEIRLQAAVKRIHSNLQSRVRKGSMTEGHYRKAVACLVGSTSYEGFDKVDVVVEAAVEVIPVKLQIFQELDKVCSPRCILASNTSSFDLSVITEGVSCPERIVGAHFFSPAHVMRLLEVIRSEKTSEQTILSLLSLTKMLRKVPVVVKNTVGFAVNRVFFPYRRMALFLVDLGIHPYRIDAVIKDFGMPMGPFRLEDLAGHTIGAYVQKLFKQEFGDRIYTSPLEGILVRENRIGESVGKGYYNYYGTRDAQHAPELDKYLEESRKVANLPQGRASPITDKDIVEMVFFPIVNEACRVVDDRIVVRASDLDIASVLGMGFPAFRGGVLFWAETISFAYILSRLSQWQSIYGSYFRPTSSLQKLVAVKASRL